MAQSNYKGNRKSKNGRSNNPRRNSRKGSPDSGKREFEASVPQNDPAWYSKYPQLVADTASLWFSNPLGSYVQRCNYSASDSLSSLHHVPGIITLDTLAVPGYSGGPSSPINAVCRGIYSFIRHANSGHANYDAPDLMMYLLAMDNCYSVWAMAVRAYGIARHYAIKNRYLGKQWLTALGFNAENIIMNLAQFRGIINSFAVKLGSYAVPANMDYFRRHTDMYTKVFLDEPSEKAQAYAFKLGRYYQLELEGETGTALSPYLFPAASRVTDIYDIMVQVLNPIINDEDMNIMSGDILKAFGESGIFKVPMISEEYETPFVFDEMVLSQIENSMVLPSMNTDSLKITQNPENGAILYMPKLNSEASRTMMIAKILNLHRNDPSAMDVMEATRLMYNVQPTGNAYVYGFGSELVLSYTLWNFEDSGEVTSYGFNPSVWNHDIPFSNIAQWMGTLGNFEQFNYHPRITLWEKDASDKRWLVHDSFLLDNYTTLPDAILENISNVAMLSLFDAGRIALATQ